MQILLFGDKGLVTSAVAEKNKIAFEMLVNLRERGCSHHRKGYSSLYAQSVDYKATQHHDAIEVSWNPTWGYDVEDESLTETCDVVFLAESEEEWKMMCGVSYESMEKDQLVILKIQPELLLGSETLVKYATEPNKPAMRG